MICEAIPFCEIWSSLFYKNEIFLGTFMSIILNTRRDPYSTFSA